VRGKRKNADALIVLSTMGNLVVYMPEAREDAFAYAKRIRGIVTPAQIIADYRPRTESNAGGHAE
jgi:hypothetical protein